MCLGVVYLGENNVCGVSNSTLLQKNQPQWIIPFLDKLLNYEYSIAKNAEVWLQNIVKCGKYNPVKFANLYTFVLCVENMKSVFRFRNVITRFRA